MTEALRTSREIDGQGRTVRELFSGRKYAIHGRSPFELVGRIGVHSESVRTQVREVVPGGSPPVEVRPEGYF